MSEEIRVLLVDDQPLMSTGVAMILESSPDIRVVGTAENGEIGIEQARSLKPDVICMDVQMPKMGGLEATAVITKDPDLDCAVVILTTFQQEDYLTQALEAGACGYLLKNSRPETVIDAVRAAAAGDGLIAPELTKIVIKKALASSPPHPIEKNKQTEALTAREIEVFELVAEGHSNAEIAEQLFVGIATVKTHVSNILLKLDLRDRVQAVVWAHRHGVVK